MYKMIAFFVFVSLLGVNAFSYAPGTWEDFAARLSARNKAAEQKLQKEIERQALLNQRLAEAIEKGVLTSDQLRILMGQRADACKLLPAAVKADNADAVGILFSYSSSCSAWDEVVSNALKLAIQKKSLNAYKALLAHGAPCQDPFNMHKQDVRKSEWIPVEPLFLKAYIDACKTTPQARSQFLSDTVSFNNNSALWMADKYRRFLTTREMASTWENTIALMISWGIRVSDSTLSKMIYESRSISGKAKQKPACFARRDGKFDPECSQKNYLPLDVTLRLVRLSLKGGADGKAVAARLQSDKGDWVRERYSKDEWWRLLNVLEGKDERESRSWASRTYRKVQNWF